MSSRSSDDEEEEPITDEQEYHVESVQDMRQGKTEREFLIKWKDFPHSDNTWEPQSNIYATNLVEDYLAKIEQEKTEKEKKKPKPVKPPKKTLPYEDEADLKTRGFERGLAAEKIFGAFEDSNGDMMFIMKWKNDDDADIVKAKEANQRCPQVVIQFYEERITWHNNEDADLDLSHAP